MSETAELRAPETPVDRDTVAMLRALRIAHAKLRTVLLEVEDIAEELKAGRLTPMGAMRICMETGIDTLFPRGLDGA